MNDTSTEKSAEAQPSSVEAVPTKDPAVRTFIFAAMLLGFALWCVVDRRKPPDAWDMKHINQVAAYLTNNWGPVVLIPLGLIVLIRGILFLRGRLLADSEGIGLAGKEKIAWEDIASVDATQLKGKGVLRIAHGDDQELKLCDWHWKRDGFHAVVASIERHVPSDQIRQ